MLIVCYILTIPLANYLVVHFGTTCVPQGPCLIPVAPGIMAPSGVLMIGAALLFRDLVQRRHGIKWSLVCILAGTMLSFLIAAPALALASGTAFLVSELTDFTVYTPLARKRFVTALIVSCLAGAVADSVLFLWLAFGSLEHLLGQVIGKGYAVLAYAGVRGLTRRVKVSR